jgi:hypothetical protein
MNPQIDLPARKKLCGLMRQFAIGRINNDEFDLGFEAIDSKDKTMWGIGLATFAYYNDYQAVRLIGRYRLSSGDRKRVARWILFLQSGLTYQNIQPSFPTRLRAFLSSLTFGIVPKGRNAEDDECYEREVWPFATQAALDETRRHPKLLCGLHS